MTMVDTQKTKGKRALAQHRMVEQGGGEEGENATPTVNTQEYTYEHLKSGGTFRWSWDEANEGERKMLAYFGAKTLCTNEASAVKQKGHDGVDPTPAIGERFALLRTGQFVDRSREGFTINLDALAAAFVDEFAANGKTYDVSAVKQKMEDDKEFVKRARSNTGINARYIERIGRPAATLDQLAEGLE